MIFRSISRQSASSRRYKNMLATCQRLRNMPRPPAVTKRKRNHVGAVQMISNFDEVKKQLSELSEVINKFKFEAVQLRIVEIVLGNGSYHEQIHETPNDASGKSATKQRRRKATRSIPKLKVGPEAAEGDKTAKKSRPSGQGAQSTLGDLVGGSFFDKPKTINDIVLHCEAKLARRFKSNEFSGKLGRLTRDGTLDRNKNGDGQYEYVKA